MTPRPDRPHAARGNAAVRGAAALAAVLAAAPRGSAAQPAPAAPAGAPAPTPPAPCHVVCAPQLAFTSSNVRSYLFGSPRYVDLATGAPGRLGTHNNWQVQLVVAVPTAIPRVGVNASFQWLPTAYAASNPFTAYTATDEGRRIRSNTPSLTFFASVDALTAGDTRGWLDLAAYAGDNVGPAARPEDRSDYTHKADVGATATVHVFSRLPRRAWLRAVSLYGTLDYIAGGLPRAGDEVPKGARRYTSGGALPSLITGASIALAPVP